MTEISLKKESNFFLPVLFYKQNSFKKISHVYLYENTFFCRYSLHTIKCKITLLIN